MIASGEYKGTTNTGLTIGKNLNFIKYGDSEAIFNAEDSRRIWFVTATSINIIGLTFKNGKADNGGAIYFSNAISNSNINATFINNTATRVFQVQMLVEYIPTTPQNGMVEQTTSHLVFQLQMLVEYIPTTPQNRMVEQTTSI